MLYEDPRDREALRNLGIAYTEAGRNEESERTLAYYLDRYPDDVEALEGLGCAFYRQGAFFKSAELFEKALKIKPQAPSVLRNLGLARIAVGRNEEGYESLKKAHLMNLFDYKTAYAFAAACRKTGRIEEAEEVLTELLQNLLPEEFENSVRRDLESLRRSRLR